MGIIGRISKGVLVGGIGAIIGFILGVIVASVTWYTVISDWIFDSFRLFPDEFWPPVLTVIFFVVGLLYGAFSQKQVKFKPVVGKKVPYQRYCSACGKQIPPNTKFCVHCGPSLSRD